jgi:membrane protein DedA with SNARE-associated domain
MPFGRFLLADVAGALVWVPLVLALGAQLGDEIGGLDRLIAWVGRMGLWVGGAILLLLAVWTRWRAEESKF